MRERSDAGRQQTAAVSAASLSYDHRKVGRKVGRDHHLQKPQTCVIAKVTAIGGFVFLVHAPACAIATGDQPRAINSVLDISR
jgi:hypothetical protein